jgi:transcriptional regulator with XRE-family HTH domain
MTKRSNGHDAVRLAKQVVKLTGDAVFERATARLERKLKQKPLQAIIAMVPGDTLVEKAQKLGVSRQAVYRWFNGTARPNEKQAKKIAKLTGAEVDIIRGV